MTLERGWLQRQGKIATQATMRWPKWMRDGVGIKGETAACSNCKFESECQIAYFKEPNWYCSDWRWVKGVE